MYFKAKQTNKQKTPKMIPFITGECLRTTRPSDNRVSYLKEESLGSLIISIKYLKEKFNIVITFKRSEERI